MEAADVLYGVLYGADGGSWRPVPRRSARSRRRIGVREYRLAMTTWSAPLGDAEPEQEQAAEPGFFGRLRDSLGKSRRALTDQLAAAAFDPADDEAWERLRGGAHRRRRRRAGDRRARRAARGPQRGRDLTEAPVEEARSCSRAGNARRS